IRTASRSRPRCGRQSRYGPSPVATCGGRVADTAEGVGGGVKKRRPGIPTKYTGSPQTLQEKKRCSNEPEKAPTAIIRDMTVGTEEQHGRVSCSYSKPTTTPHAFTDRQWLFFVSGIVLPRQSEAPIPLAF